MNLTHGMVNLTSQMVDELVNAYRESDPSFDKTVLPYMHANMQYIGQTLPPVMWPYAVDLTYHVVKQMLRSMSSGESVTH